MVGRSCMATFSRAETLALSRFAIDWATSVSMANTSFKSRSYSSAQMPASVRVSTNCAFTCTLPPERRTVPSSTCETRSALPIWRTSCLPRYCMTLVRLITFRSAIFASLVKMSSWTPSAKNACSFSSLRFSNGSTAMPVVTGCRDEFTFRNDPTRGGCESNERRCQKRAGWIASHPFLSARENSGAASQNRLVL